MNFQDWALLGMWLPTGSSPCYKEHVTWPLLHFINKEIKVYYSVDCSHVWNGLWASRTDPGTSRFIHFRCSLVRPPVCSIPPPPSPGLVLSPPISTFFRGEYHWENLFCLPLAVDWLFPRKASSSRSEGEPFLESPKALTHNGCEWSAPNEAAIITQIKSWHKFSF